MSHLQAFDKRTFANEWERAAGMGVRMVPGMLVSAVFAELVHEMEKGGNS